MFQLTAIIAKFFVYLTSFQQFIIKQSKWKPRTSMFCLETVWVCVCVCVLTLAHGIKGLNEGFDSSSWFCAGISTGIRGRCGDHGDATPVTTVVRVRHSHLVSWRPGRHNGHGQRLYTVLGSTASLHIRERTVSTCCFLRANVMMKEGKDHLDLP